MEPMVKAVILAGGPGTRISEETLSAKAHNRNRGQADYMAPPRNLLALWHQRLRICCSYKDYVIKEYLTN